MLTSIQREENLTTGASADSIISCVTATNITNGSNGILRNRYRRLEEDTRCLCHEKPKPTDRKARNKLIAACMIVFVFMIGEVIGKEGSLQVNYSKVTMVANLCVIRDMNLLFVMQAKLDKYNSICQDFFGVLD